MQMQIQMQMHIQLKLQLVIPDKDQKAVQCAISHMIYANLDTNTYT